MGNVTRDFQKENGTAGGPDIFSLRIFVEASRTVLGRGPERQGVVNRKRVGNAFRDFQQENRAAGGPVI